MEMHYYFYYYYYYYIISVDNWLNLVEDSHKTGLFLSVENIKYFTFNRQSVRQLHVLRLIWLVYSTFSSTTLQVF